MRVCGIVSQYGEKLQSGEARETHVLVVVNGSLRGLVETGVDGRLEVADVEDVGGGVVDETAELAGGGTGFSPTVVWVVLIAAVVSGTALTYRVFRPR